MIFYDPISPSKILKNEVKEDAADTAMAVSACEGMASPDLSPQQRKLFIPLDSNKVFIFSRTEVHHSLQPVVPIKVQQYVSVLMKQFSNSLQ